MSAYLSEEEQVEAIKKWWKENGMSVVGGAVLGFAIIFGWQGWGQYRTAQGENASILFSTLENQVRAGDNEAAVSTAKRLIGDYGDSVYAGFAALQVARLSYEQGDKAVAREHLRWTVENASDPTIAGLARLRLGRLLLDLGEADAAAAIAAAAGDFMPGAFAELRGDIARAQGDSTAARRAYDEALQQGVDDAALVRMKLVDLGSQGGAS